MSDIEYLDIAEFQRLGYLQEANRLFFHPLGLALEIRQLTGSWDDEEPGEWMQARIHDVTEAICSQAGLGTTIDHEAVHRFALAVCKALWPEGTRYFSGVWDSRDDPEGVYFADGVDADKATAVDAERACHFNHRVELFAHVPRASGPVNSFRPEPVDVQPVNWTPTNQQEAN